MFNKKEYFKNYYKSNRGKLIEYQKKYNKTNNIQYKEYQKEYYKKKNNPFYLTEKRPLAFFDSKIFVPHEKKTSKIIVSF
jgi:hypothetical protein